MRILFLTFFLSIATMLKAKSIVIAADVWCPYNCTPKTDRPGYMVEIVKESFKLYSKEKVIYKIYPWERAMREARKGNIAGIIGAIDSESKGLHMPSSAQGMMLAHFFKHSKDQWKYTSIKNIVANDKTIGLIKGYDFDNHILKFTKKHPDKVHYVFGHDALPKLISLVKNRRVDAIVEDQAVFWYKVKTLNENSSHFKSAGAIGKPKKLYVSFYRKDHAEIVSKGTEALRKSGKLAKILKKYNLKDWK